MKIKGPIKCKVCEAEYIQCQEMKAVDFDWASDTIWVCFNCVNAINDAFSYKVVEDKK
jgi:hypothetical protein